MVLACPFAHADTYVYPEEKQPAISLQEACRIAEKIIDKVGLTGCYALNAYLLGDEQQSGAGAWNLTYGNVKGQEILVGVMFPKNLVVYQGPAKTGEFMMRTYSRDGEMSKDGMEAEAKITNDPFGPSPNKPSSEKQAEQAGASDGEKP